MANFCEYCGARLENDAMCSCQKYNPQNYNITANTSSHQEPVKDNKNPVSVLALSIVSLVCGISGIIFGIASLGTSIVIPIAAIITGCIGKKKALYGVPKMSKCGFILGIIGTALSAVIIIASAIIN